MLKTFHHCDRSVALLMLIMAATASIIAVSSQSIWIDEAYTAGKAMQDSFGTWWEQMQLHKGSDIQMPLYMLSIWGWEKIFGHSEFALRAMNIPLFLTAIVSILYGLRLSLSVRVFFVLFACTSAFVWAYLDEARPYMMQFCAATLAMVPMVNITPRLEKPRPADLVLFTTGILVLCGSSLIGVVYSLFFGLAFLLFWIRRERIQDFLTRKDFWLCASLGGVILGILGVYYAWTLQAGARASDVGRTSLLTLGFVFYELIGFSGLGPGRAELRIHAASALKPFLPFLLLYAGILVLFLGSSAIYVSRNLIGRWNQNKPQLLDFGIVLFGLILPVATITALGLMADFRVIGRHFMPVFPFILFGFAIFGAAAWTSGSTYLRFFVILFLFAATTSALTFRFSTTHAKDDYRSAAGLALAALHQGDVVWWAADTSAGQYYGLPIVTPQELEAEGGEPTVTSAVLIRNLPDSALEEQPRPAIIFVSKRDIYDPKGILTSHLVKKHFIDRESLPAFEVWSPRISDESRP